jgi:transcriptional regulator with XRE-family HTH domain
LHHIREKPVSGHRLFRGGYVKRNARPADPEKDVRAFKIGRKIRDLRKRKVLTLQDLSTQTGLSKPLLSQIENDIVIPPIATLLKISRALDKDITFFLQEPHDERKIAVVRASERKRLETRRPGQTPGDYFYESLAYKKGRKNMEPFLIEFEPRDEKDMSFYSHTGEEFIFILEGSVEFRTAKDVHRLEAGDSLYFESDVPHAYRALGKGSARAIAIIYSTP